MKPDHPFNLDWRQINFYEVSPAYAKSRPTSAPQFNKKKMLVKSVLEIFDGVTSYKSKNVLILLNNQFFIENLMVDDQTDRVNTFAQIRLQFQLLLI